MSADGTPSEGIARGALPKLRGMRGVRVTGRMTVTPANAARLAVNVRGLFAAGLRRIVFLPDLSSAWDSASIAAWSAQQSDLADWLLTLSRARLPAPELPDWRRITDRLDGAPRQHCGAGVSRLTVDVEGTLFPCHRVAFDARRAGLEMGDVRSGVVNEEVRERFARLDPDRPLLEAGSCDDCPAASGCTIFCPALGLQLTGDIRRVPQISCALMRPQVAACARLAHEQQARGAGTPRRSRTAVAVSALAAAATLGATGCLEPAAEYSRPDAGITDAGMRADSGNTLDAGRPDAGEPDDGGCPPYCPGIC